MRVPFNPTKWFIMKNLFAIKVIAVCACCAWATTAFSRTSVENQSVAAGSALTWVAASSPVVVVDEPVKVSKAWVRNTVPGQKGSGAFMTLTARTGTRLVGLASPVAGVAEVHEMKMEGDVMRMRALPALELPAGTAVELKPGGYHIMLMDLKQPLIVGSSVPVTLIFKDGKGVESRLDLQLPVANAAVAAAAAGGLVTPLKTGKDSRGAHVH